MNCSIVRQILFSYYYYFLFRRFFLIVIFFVRWFGFAIMFFWFIVFFPQFCDSFFVLSDFSDLNPRWSGWPRRQTQTVFGTMSRITIMFIAPLTSDHRGFRRYRSLLLLFLFISMVKQGAARWRNVHPACYLVMQWGRCEVSLGNTLLVLEELLYRLYFEIGKIF